MRRVAGVKVASTRRRLPPQIRSMLGPAGQARGSGGWGVAAGCGCWGGRASSKRSGTPCARLRQPSPPRRAATAPSPPPPGRSSKAAKQRTSCAPPDPHPSPARVYGALPHGVRALGFAWKCPRDTRRRRSSAGPCVRSELRMWTACAEVPAASPLPLPPGLRAHRARGGFLVGDCALPGWDGSQGPHQTETRTKQHRRLRDGGVAARAGPGAQTTPAGCQLAASLRSLVAWCSIATLVLNVSRFMQYSICDSSMCMDMAGP